MNWYRFKDVLYASTEIDITGEPVVGAPGTLKVELLEYEVIKTTPKGVWLNVYGERRFVRTDARKRFACPTVEEAKASFVARKKAQIRIYRSRLRDAELALDLISTGVHDGSTTARSLALI